MKTFALLLCVAGLAAFTVQEKEAAGIQAVTASGIKWEKPEGAPAGIMAFHVSGDAKQGPIVDLLKFAAGTKVPLHYHSANHVVTVLSGVLVIGNSAEDVKGTAVEAGGYFIIPSKTPHWTLATKETVISVSGDTPNDLHLVEGSAK